MLAIAVAPEHVELVLGLANLPSDLYLGLYREDWNFFLQCSSGHRKITNIRLYAQVQS